MKNLSKITGLASALALTALPVLAQDAEPTLDTGDTAWMIVATALVAFMIFPGIALVYSGLVRAKNALSLLVQTAIIAGAVMVIWVVYG